MRLFERLQYLSGLLYYSFFLFTQQYYVNLSLSILLLMLIPVGYCYEGIRFHQFPSILGFLIQFVVFLITNGAPIALTIIDGLLLLISISFLFLYGESDFKRLKLTGPYEVGYKDFRTFKYGNQGSVYYPVDREHYRSAIKTQNTQWLRYGSKTAKGIAKASTGYGKQDKSMPMSMFRHLFKIQIDAVLDGVIAQDFTNNQRPLIPIIYSHGISSSRTMHSGSCRDLASHGYIVIMIDHQDGTTLYYEDKDGKGFTYDNTMNCYELEYRKGLMKIRENEIEALIDEIQDQGSFLEGQLGFPEGVKIDMDRLIIGGHSFGGMTAIAVASTDKRVKACITLDPWLYVYHNEIIEGSLCLNVPFIEVSTEMFHPLCDLHFPSTEALKKMLDHSIDKRQESILVKKCGHLHQCDLSVLIPFELYTMRGHIPKTSTNETYLLMSQLLISFLSRIQFNNSFHSQHVDKYIEAMSNEWLDYKIKYDGSEYTPPQIIEA